MKKSVSVSKAQPGAEITSVQIVIEKASRKRIQTPQMFKKSLTVSFKPENGMIIYSGLAKRQNVIAHRSKFIQNEVKATGVFFQKALKTVP